MDLKSLIERLQKCHNDPSMIEHVLRSYYNVTKGTKFHKIIDDNIDYFRLLKKPKKYSSTFEDTVERRIEWVIMQLKEQ